MNVKHCIYSLILTLFGSSAFSQITFTSQVPIGISSSKDVLFIGGNLENQNSSNLVNNGKLYVTKNINNEQANMQAGTGTLYLKGKTEQTVSGSKTFNAYNLNTDNIEGIKLEANLTISNFHQFSNGVVTTKPGETYLIYKSNASYTGDDDKKHVKGTVKKYGSTDFDFPVGNGNMERKAGLKNISEASVFSCTYAETAPTSKATKELKATSESESWNITQSEKYNASANVVLSFNGNKKALPNSITDASLLKVGHLVNDKWNNEGGNAKGSVNEDGKILSTKTNVFGVFGLGIIEKAETEKPIASKQLTEHGLKKIDNLTYHLSFVIENENGEGTYEISYKNNNGAIVKLTELLASTENGIYNTELILPEAVENIEFTITEMSVRVGTKHLANISSNEATANADEDEAITVLGNGAMPSLKIKSLIDNNTTYTLEIYDMAGRLVSATNDIQVSAQSEQIVPLDLPLIERGMFTAVLISNRKKKKSIKIAH
jgi:hypothetical protein